MPVWLAGTVGVNVPYGDVLFSEIYDGEEQKGEKMRGAGNRARSPHSSRVVLYGGSRVIEGGANGEVEEGWRWRRRRRKGGDGEKLSVFSAGPGVR